MKDIKPIEIDWEQPFYKPKDDKWTLEEVKNCVNFYCPPLKEDERFNDWYLEITEIKVLGNTVYQFQTKRRISSDSQTCFIPQQELDNSNSGCYVIVSTLKELNWLRLSQSATEFFHILENKWFPNRFNPQEELDEKDFHYWEQEPKG